MMVLLLTLAGLAIAFGLLISRSRHDELQWRMGLKIGLGVIAIYVPTYFLTSFPRALYTAPNSDTPMVFSAISTIALAAFIFGLMFLGAVLAESLSAEHRPTMFGGLAELTRGRVTTPEIVTAAAHGAIWGTLLAAAQTLIAFASVSITGTHPSISVPEVITTSVPVIDILDNFGDSVSVALLLACLQLVLYHLRRSAVFAVAGSIAVLVTINVLTPDTLMVWRINGLAMFSFLSLVLWRYGFLAAVLAIFVAELLVPLSAQFWNGSSGGIAGALLAVAAFVAPFALAIVVYRRLSGAQAGQLSTRSRGP